MLYVLAELRFGEQEILLLDMERKSGTTYNKFRGDSHGKGTKVVVSMYRKIDYQKEWQGHSVSRLGHAIVELAGQGGGRKVSRHPVYNYHSY